MTQYAILNYIWYSNQNSKYLIIFNDILSISYIGNGKKNKANNILETKGITVIWVNGNDQTYGYSLNIKDIKNVFHISFAFALPMTAAF